MIQTHWDRLKPNSEKLKRRFKKHNKKLAHNSREIDNLKDALEKREALGGEQREAQQELERWQRVTGDNSLLMLYVILLWRLCSDRWAV